MKMGKKYIYKAKLETNGKTIEMNDEKEINDIEAEILDAINENCD